MDLKRIDVAIQEVPKMVHQIVEANILVPPPIEKTKTFTSVDLTKEEEKENRSYDSSRSSIISSNS